MVQIDFSEKMLLALFWAKRAKMGGAVGLIGSEMNVFQHISIFVHQILMKLSGKVLGLKRMKTDEFGHMFAHSCLGMPII